MKSKLNEVETLGLGIDLGGTKIAGALFNENDMASPKAVSYLENRSGKEVGEEILKLIQNFLNRASKNNQKIKSIGIAVPGIYYSKTGIVWAPNIPGWNNYPLYEELAKKFNPSGIRIKIDSDRACYILGESWKGSAIGCRDAIYLAVGTGIGAGILINGKVLRGSSDIAGAIGWMALTHPYLPDYSKYGCFEYHASGEGLTRIAKNFHDKEKSFIKDADQQPEEFITTRDVFKDYLNGNPIAKKVIKQSIEFWGKASANLVSLFNPEKIIFGGGVFGPAVQFLDQIYLEAKKWAQPISIDLVKFEASKLGNDAGLYGAGFLSLNSEIDIPKKDA
ncbi:MAG: ROK family protein [Bacteroidales bacterium]|nr:ROK family protein [Bacteroidales bacterium]